MTAGVSRTSTCLRDLLISEFAEVNEDLDAALAEFEKTETKGNAAIERSEAILRALHRCGRRLTYKETVN